MSFLPSASIPEKWFLRRGKRRVMWIATVDIRIQLCVALAASPCTKYLHQLIMIA